MKNSRLIHILKTFSKREEREMRKWLQSPVHNQREDVILLFEYLVSKNHLQKEKYLYKEKVFPKVYPNEPFEDAKMRQVIYFLLKAIDSFLTNQELGENQIRAKTALASVYRKRGLKKPFQKIITELINLQESQVYRDGDYLRNGYLIQLEEYYYLSGLKRTAENNLQGVSDALDNTYIADKLRQSCLMMAHQTVYKTNYEIGLLEPVLKYVEEKQLLKIPAIAMYYFSYKSIIDRENEQHFFNLKKEITHHAQLFPKSEMRDIYLLMLNYCIKRLNAGVKTFLRETFEIYKDGIEMGFLIENNLISRFTFQNAVINGTLLKEFVWVEKFINDYQQFLEERFRENVVHYCLAKLYFEKGTYSEAMQMLIQYEYDDILMNLNAKKMLMRIYYEQDEYDALESLIESMRTYMHRKQVIGYHKANTTNFLSLTKKLVNINPYNKLQKSKLKKEIEEVNPLIVTERQWLLKQLETL